MRDLSTFIAALND